MPELDGLNSDIPILRFSQQEIERRIDSFIHQDISNLRIVAKPLIHSGERPASEGKRLWLDEKGKFTVKDSFCGLTCLYMILRSQYALLSITPEDFIVKGLNFKGLEEEVYSTCDS